MPSIDLNRLLESKQSPSYSKRDFFTLGVNSQSLTEPGKYSSNSVETNSDYAYEIYARAQASGTPELAAEEKYAYARYHVSEGGLPAFAAEALILTPGYAALKAILPDSLRQTLLRTGPGRVSPASIDQVLKGLQGAIDGLKDYYGGSETRERGSSFHLMDPKDLDFTGSRVSDDGYRPLYSEKYNFKDSEKAGKEMLRDSFHDGRGRGDRGGLQTDLSATDPSATIFDRKKYLHKGDLKDKYVTNCR